MSAPPPAGSAGRFAAVFEASLRELGWDTGRNVRLEYRYAAGDTKRLPQLAAELVRLNVDLVVAFPTPAVDAAKRVTTTIPIVMLAGEPVATGLVTSLARPGGNVTGISATSAETAGKRLEMMRELRPGLTSVAVLVHPTDPFARPFRDQNEHAARAAGISARFLVADGPHAVDRAFAALAPGDALIVQPILAQTNETQIVQLAARHRVATVSERTTFADAGGLMAYGAATGSLFRRLAVYADRILKGAKPAELPVEQPSTFELVINLKTAKSLGLTIPNSLLLRADRVVQ